MTAGRMTAGAVMSLAVLGGTVGANMGASAADLDRGAYLAQIMDCGGCHTPGVLAGTPDMTRALAGSEIGFEIPGLGIFYPPNLTPDAATGLGSWTAEQMVTAITTGVRPDGRILAPIMPYHAYSALTPDDAAALVAYLRTLAPVSNQVPSPVGPEGKAVAPYLGPKTP
ncbi:c-type cytochrome [Futiania mangrovi]